jgi:chromosome segregation ATPase
MKHDISQSQDIDLDRTDRLPVLEGVLPEDDVVADAATLEHAAAVQGAAVIASQRGSAEFPRPTSVDLPSLAESIRSVEERIARQRAEYEALVRSYELARDAETASAARANALAADLTAARATLEAEQRRARELDNKLSETSLSAESLRARSEEAIRELERYQNESRTLRDSLATRDATIVQILQSLGERDAQLTALQHEHGKLVPELEVRTQSGRQLEVELKSARARADAIKSELVTGKESLAAQAEQLKRGDFELNAARVELGATKATADAYLERLRSREFRNGINQNLYRELDAEVSAATASLGGVRAERDVLKEQLADRDAKLAAQEEAIRKLNSTTASDALTLEKRAGELELSEKSRADLAAQLADRDAKLATQEATIRKLTGAAAADALTLEQRASELERSEKSRSHLAAQVVALQAEGARLNEELAARDATIAEARAAGTGEAQRHKELLAAAEQRLAEQVAQISQLQSEAQSTEQEMNVLVAHLHEARRPMQSVQSEIKRLTDELSAKTTVFEELNEENQKLRSTLERTRGALEEREFLIRRLERAESNNANALGRIQTSMERLGAPSPSAAGTPGPEMKAELLRIEGDRSVAHALSRRTRIGRAHGCELQIDSTSVSRHHAMILLGPRDAIIEDLNSTNGVIVNGRKVTRQLLHDGDEITIGEAQFRFAGKPAPQAGESAAPDPLAGA